MTLLTGYPDYSRGGAQSFGAGLDDLAELAARLGSPVSFYRTGKVMYYDQFDTSILGWSTLSVGAGTVAWDNTWAYTGDGCVLFTGDAAIPEILRLQRYLPLPGQQTIGLECVLAAKSSTPALIDLRVVPVIDGVQYGFAVLVYPTTGIVEINNSGGGATQVGTINPILSSPELPCIMKLVVDVGNESYRRIRINDEHFDVSDYSPLSGALAVEDCVWVVIEMFDIPGAAPETYVDNVIVTVEEP